MSGGTSDYFFSSSEDEGKSVSGADKENADPNILGRGDDGKKQPGSSGMRLKNVPLGNTQLACAKSSPKVKTTSHSNAEDVPKHPDARNTLEKLKPYCKDLGNWIKSCEGYTKHHHQDLLKAMELLEDVCEENVASERKQATDIKILLEVQEKDKGEEYQVLYNRVEALETQVMDTIVLCSKKEAANANLLSKGQHLKAAAEVLEKKLSDHRQCCKSKSDSWKSEGMDLVRQLTSLQKENQTLKNEIESVKVIEGSSEKCKGDKAEAPPELVTAFENACCEKTSLEAKLLQINKELYSMKKKVKKLEKEVAVSSVHETCQEGKDHLSADMKMMQDMTDKFRRDAEEIWSKYENVSSSSVSLNTPESAVLKKIENKYKKVTKDFQIKFLCYCQSEIWEHFHEEMRKADNACLQKCHEKFMYYSARLKKSIKEEYDARLQKCVQEAKEKAIHNNKKMIESLQEQAKVAKFETESLKEQQNSSKEKLDTLNKEIISRLKTCMEQLQLLFGNSNNGVESTQAECSTGARVFQADCPPSMSEFSRVSSSSASHKLPSAVIPTVALKPSNPTYVRKTNQICASPVQSGIAKQTSARYKGGHPSKIPKTKLICTSPSIHPSAKAVASVGSLRVAVPKTMCVHSSALSHPQDKATVSSSATHMGAGSSPSVQKTRSLFPLPSSNLQVQTVASPASTPRADCPSCFKEIKKTRHRSTSVSSCPEARAVASSLSGLKTYYPAPVLQTGCTGSLPSYFPQVESLTAASAAQANSPTFFPVTGYVPASPASFMQPVTFVLTASTPQADNLAYIQKTKQICSSLENLSQSGVAEQTSSGHKSEYPSKVPKSRRIHKSPASHRCTEAVALRASLHSTNPEHVYLHSSVLSHSQDKAAVSASATRMAGSSPSVQKTRGIFPSLSNHLQVQTVSSLDSTHEDRLACCKKSKKTRYRSTSFSGCTQAATVASPAHNADYPLHFPKLQRTYSSPSVFSEAGFSADASTPYSAS